MITDTVMMDLEEHLTEESQLKFSTRSAARHLRRKRLHDARKAEKEQEFLINGANVTLNRESVTEKDTDQLEVITKSRAQTVTSEEVLAAKNTEDRKTLSKSKARRLRKKEKTKSVQSTCSFCYNTYASPIDSVLLKYIKTTEDSVCCVKREKESTNDLKQNHEPERAVEAQVCDLQCDKSNSLDNSVNYKKTKESVDSVKLDQNTEFRNSKRNKRNSCELESSSVELKEGNTLLEKETESKTSSGSNTTSGTVTSCAREELPENVNNLRFNDSSEKDSVRASSGSWKPKKGEYTSTDITEKPLETESVSNYNSIIVGNSSCNLNSEYVEHDRPVSSLKLSTKMADANRTNVVEKAREDVKAERQAKKAAKALAKAKAKTGKQEEKDTSNDKSTLPDNIKDKQSSETLESAANKPVQVQDKTCVVDKLSNTSVQSVLLEVSNEGKSKAELRAERRAKQEAQRAAKQQLVQGKSKTKCKENSNNTCVVQIIGDKDLGKKAVTPKKTVQKDDSHEINLFKHLYHEREQAKIDVPSVNSNIHPAIVRLGVQYASKVIVGSNARCVALLATVKQLIQDFERPSQVDFIRGLEATLQKSVAYLHYCRPLAVSMQNALRHLKWQMTQLPSVLSDADAKHKLKNAIDTYILEQIELADKAISITIQTKISNGDVILTYSYSSLIHKILLDAHIAGKQFRVIIVDGRPWLEGKEQLRRLAKHGIECSYILINALSYVMPEVSKVFLGAHAILANGAVMSRAGTAQVALMAKAFNIPVLVACGTHKSCERVQTDSIVYNELGNADELAQCYGIGGKKSLLANWKSKKSLNLLNITYDVTPADLVTAVVTELAILPCTSVPVILRIKPSEI